MDADYERLENSRACRLHVPGGPCNSTPLGAENKEADLLISVEENKVG